MRNAAALKGTAADDEDDDYLVVDPTNPLPPGCTGPLERSVGLPYEEALFADDVDAEAQQYWFTEPPGGWTREKRRLRKLKEVEVDEFDDLRHYGADAAGRTPLAALGQGAVLRGTVVAQMLNHGAQIDIGAEYDGLLPCEDVDMWEAVGPDDLALGAQVEVVVYRLRDDELYRFPVQLAAVSPSLAEKLVDPDAYRAPMDLRCLTMSPEEIAERSGGERVWEPEDRCLQTEEEWEYSRGLDLQRKPVPHVPLTPQQQAAMDADVEFILGSFP